MLKDYWLYRYGVALVEKSKAIPHKEYCGNCKKFQEVKEVERHECCLYDCKVCGKEIDTPF